MGGAVNVALLRLRRPIREKQQPGAEGGGSRKGEGAGVRNISMPFAALATKPGE